jgi:hypothetical protein
MDVELSREPGLIKNRPPQLRCKGFYQLIHSYPCPVDPVSLPGIAAARRRGSRRVATPFFGRLKPGTALPDDERVYGEVLRLAAHRQFESVFEQRLNHREYSIEGGVVRGPGDDVVAIGIDPRRASQYLKVPDPYAARIRKRTEIFSATNVPPG